MQAEEQERKRILPAHQGVAQNTKATLGRFTLEPEAAAGCWETGKLHLESSFRQASDPRGSRGVRVNPPWDPQPLARLGWQGGQEDVAIRLFLKLPVSP